MMIKVYNAIIRDSLLKGSIMKIQIIIHSTTGNTLSVGDKIKDKLLKDKHKVSLDMIEASNDQEPNPSKIVLTTKPTFKRVDGYVIGAPVRGFSLSPVMKAYLNTIESFNKQPVYIFVTQYFPFPFMGGNRSIKQLKQIVEAKGGKIIDSGIANWTSKKRNKMIDQIVEKAFI